jgi:hypothetical protein
LEVAKELSMVDINDAILEYVDTALFASKYLSDTDDDGNTDTYRSNINELKFRLNNYIDKIISTSDSLRAGLNRNYTQSYMHDSFNLYIYKSDMPVGRMLVDNFEYNTFVDSTKCEAKIKQANGISAGTPLVVKKLEYKWDTFSDLKKPYVTDYGVSVKFYKFDTKEELNSEICTDDAAIQYSMRVGKSPVFNLEKHYMDRYLDFDSFDYDSIYYHSRCVNKLDWRYLADTTINYRRQNCFQGVKAICPSGCKYNGILSDFLTCECQNNKQEIYYYFDYDSLGPVRSVNLDVVTCAGLTFTRPSIHTNAGFYIGLLINLAFIFTMSLCIFCKNRVVHGDLTKLYYSDYLNSKHCKDVYPTITRVKTREHEKDAPVELNDIQVTEKKELNKPVAKKSDGQIVVEVRNTPGSSGSGPNNDLIRTTLRDIDMYPASEALSDHIDDREVKTYLFDYFTERTFFSLILKTSILIPLWVRFAYCLLFISILCVLNAMLFSDEAIDQRTVTPEVDREMFGYTLANETVKVVISLYLTKALLVLFRWIWKPRAPAVVRFNETMALKDDEHILIALNEYHNDRKVYNHTLLGFSFVVHLWTIYYCICFCGVYPQASKGWVYGIIWGFILHMIHILMVHPIGLVVLRYTIKIFRWTILDWIHFVSDV